MKPDVFISYSSQDRDDVRPIVEALEKAHFSVWWDREIGAGAKFERKIEAALDNAKCVVVLWSRNSVESDWVRAEAHEGMARGVLVPVVIDNTRPPLAFRQTQQVKIDDGYAALITAIRQHIADNEKSVDISPHVHYVNTPDGARLAYVQQGEGFPIVRSLGWSTSCALDLNGENVLTNELVRDFHFITYDGRGGGMSAEGDYKWTIDERLCDLKTVIEASNPKDKFALFGISEGSRAAIIYASENPDRVSHLILDSPSLPFFESNPTAYDTSEWFIEFVRSHWGSDNTIASRMLCSVWSQSASPEEQRVFMKRQLESMSAETAARYIYATASQNLDPKISKRVWDAAAKLKAPTLIFHAIQDPLASYELSEKLAAVVPNAELIPSTLPDHGCVLSSPFARLQAREVKRFILGG